MQVEFTGARRVAGALMLVLLGACSGGSDGETTRQLQLSTNSLNFMAASPIGAAPPAQVITATFSTGIANIAALHTGPAIEDVRVEINGSSAQITVVPAAPSVVGAGQFKGTIALTAYFCGNPACTRLEAGASSTAITNYQVSPLVTDIAPSIAIAGAADKAIIRGVGFQGFAIQGVNFSGTPATEFTVADDLDTQITVAYPAFAAGAYTVSLDAATHSGAIPSNATLTVVEPVMHTAGTLAWPAPTANIHALEYDMRSGALLVATDANGGQLVRYPYSAGAWQAPLTASVANLRDATLSIDGAQWLAIGPTSLTPVDPVTLTLGTAVEAPSLPENTFLKSIAMLNSNIAMVTTGIAESKVTPLYSYTVRDGSLVQLGSQLNNATARAPANAAVVALIQGHPSSTDAPVLLLAVAATSQLSSSLVLLNQNSIAPVYDRHATRLVLNGTLVYDSSTTLLGTLPNTTAAVVLHPDGTRAYTYDTSVDALRVFDISATPSGEVFPAMGDPIPLVAAPGSNIKMAISADANTLFIAGTDQIVVQPTPVL